MYGQKNIKSVIYVATCFDPKLGHHQAIPQGPEKYTETKNIS